MTGSVTAETVQRAADRLLARIASWTPSRFAATASGVLGSAIPSGASMSSASRAARPNGAPPPSRGDVLHAVAQRLADLDADVEGEPRRMLPRLERDAGLPDQLALVVGDLLAADPPPDVLRQAQAALESAAAATR